MASHEKSEEKNEAIQKEFLSDGDDDVDAADNISINDAARGDNLPDNYYMSISFIGTVAVRTLQLLVNAALNLTTNRAYVLPK